MKEALLVVAGLAGGIYALKLYNERNIPMGPNVTSSAGTDATGNESDNLKIEGQYLLFRTAYRGPFYIEVKSNEDEESAEYRIVAMEQGPTNDRIELTWLNQPGIQFYFRMRTEDNRIISTIRYGVAGNPNPNGNAVTGSTSGGTNINAGATEIVNPAGSQTTTTPAGNAGVLPDQGIQVGTITEVRPALTLHPNLVRRGDTYVAYCKEMAGKSVWVKGTLNGNEFESNIKWATFDSSGAARLTVPLDFPVPSHIVLTHIMPDATWFRLFYPVGIDIVDDPQTGGVTTGQDDLASRIAAMISAGVPEKLATMMPNVNWHQNPNGTWTDPMNGKLYDPLTGAMIYDPDNYQAYGRQ